MNDEASDMSDEREQHNRYQGDTFDTQVNLFAQAIPKDVQQRTRRIVAAAGLMPGQRVLDVGTGLGVLIPEFRFFGIQDIVGCDLSQGMLNQALRRFPDVKFWCGDVIDLPQEFGLFDAIFFNAMFGNVFDQRLTLQAIHPRLASAGRMIISHPMGASFQAGLNHENAQLVPHRLPDRQRLTDLITGLALAIDQFYDEELLYLCCLKKE